MKNLLFCLFIFSFLLGCGIKPTFSGIFVSKAGDRIYFKHMHPQVTLSQKVFFMDDIIFVSEGNSLEFSIEDVKELYLIRDGIEESTNEKDIITEKPKEFRDINAYK